MRNGIKIDMKCNAFDFVRLMLAVFVIYAHSRYLFGAEDLLHWQAQGFDYLHVGGVGLWGFFAISGFLVTSSWFNSNGAADFFAKRLKRIMPGFWMSLLVCCFFFAPLWYFLQQHTLDNFFTINGLHIWKFISSNLDTAIVTQSIGNVAIDSVNGPLWTIHHELSAYAILGFFGVIGLLGFKSKYTQGAVILTITLLLSGVRLLYTYNSNFSSVYALWFGDERFLLFLVIFMWGVTINIYRNILVPHWIGAAFSLATLLIATHYEFLPVVFPFCFSYLIISLCFALPFKNISSKIGDLSYGVYLYHWPVRLTLQMLGFQQSLGLWAFIGLNILLTLPLAVLSWHLVEKRFLGHAKKPAAPEQNPSEKPVNNLVAQS